MQNKPVWHYRSPNKDEYEIAISEINKLKMRNKFADTIYDVSLKNEKICVLAADISPVGAISKFSEKFPKQFINCGVAEQSMIAISAGLAMEGYRPFCYTIATFSIFRPFEMVKLIYVIKIYQ